MNVSAFPTSKDIYLEINGKKIAVVQSYSVKTTRDSKTIHAFGEESPVATLQGPPSYTIELSRLYATEAAISDGISFHDLQDFSLVVCKPDCRTIYSGCQWSHITEEGTLGNTVAEKVSLIAQKRLEVSA